MFVFCQKKYLSSVYTCQSGNITGLQMPRRRDMRLNRSEGNGRRKYHGKGEVNGREEQNIK